MGKYDKFIFKILRGTSGANIAFGDLRDLLWRLGFEERIRAIIFSEKMALRRKSISKRRGANVSPTRFGRFAPYS